jgi:hypothetical protein
MTGIDFDEALACVRCRLELLRQSGIRPSPRLIAHYRNVELLAAGSASATEHVATQEESELIGTTEAARILGYSTAYVRRPEVARSLGGRRITGNSWIFNEEEVKTYATERDRHHQMGS